MDTEAKVLSGGDIRAERNRHTPIVTQEQLASELSWPWPGLIGMVETGEIPLANGMYHRMIRAIAAIIARRQEAAK